ncbi:GntR family transcriptional regulator [Paenibacillus chartarius]|uniref:GntR family transcriptional regulator n=1 Tax=Paenibacillus chartarius TaxID=747481 RepID=A0ABV6DG03_9BACL
MPIPKNFNSPARLTAKERALTQIQRWIIEGTLEPGEKLIDAELAETLAVSRTPIREALQLLEIQGLVTMHPGKETRVTLIEKDDILHLYSTLAALHSLAAETAASFITTSQLELLSSLNAQFGEAIEGGQPYRAMELDEQFHGLIIEVSDNPYIASFSSSLQVHIRRFKYVFLRQPVAGTRTSVEEHSAIIAALEKRDGEAAGAMMKRNLIRPMNELYAML